jgi:methionine biosynthesis protein MetW|tara:strand:- start:35 stop:631 length:597 start_codon:yes stop_codon:yes gene_type:complete
MRLDHEIIYKIIEPKARVLDLGCGNGDLLDKLVQGKNIKAQGIELNEDAIYKCVEKGLSVFHSDIESGLIGFPNKSNDYVILNQSLQETRNITLVIQEALRVGHKVIIGFPNFAQLASRSMVFFQGKVPITKSLPYRWYNTPNLHFLSLTDFIDFCNNNKFTILEKHFLGKNKEINFLPNLFAHNGVFVISANNNKVQ